MDLRSMIEREDFFNILAATVITYYKEAYNKDVLFCYSPCEGCEPLVVNKMLSFISRKPMCKGLYDFLDSEYNVRTSISKYILGKVAVNIVKLFPDFGKVKNAYITKGVLNMNEFINPQNRSIRIFDYDKQTVDCVIKDGFTDKYFVNQLNFRKKYKYNFILPLISYDYRWFREPILSGNSLARVTNTKLYKKGIEDAFTYISLLVNDTRGLTTVHEYIDELAASIKQHLLQAKDRKRILYFDDISQLLLESQNIIEQVSINIPTSMSHGDLQSGNIWVDKEKKTWIYDWETVERRSIWYDSSVLGYSLRHPTGWIEFVGREDYSFLLYYDEKKNYTLDEIKAIIRIVLLEDIQFYLDDMLELPKDWGNWIFDKYCERILPLFKK